MIKPIIRNKQKVLNRSQAFNDPQVMNERELLNKTKDMAVVSLEHYYQEMIAHLKNSQKDIKERISLGKKYMKEMEKLELTAKQSLTKAFNYDEIDQFVAAQPMQPPRNDPIRETIHHLQNSADRPLLVEKVKCNRCPRRFISKLQLFEHESVRHHLKFHCFQCRRDFDLVQILYLHIQVEHVRLFHIPDDSLLACSYCKQGFQKPDDIIEHLLFAHKNDLESQFRGFATAFNRDYSDDANQAAVVIE